MTRKIKQLWRPSLSRVLIGGEIKDWQQLHLVSRRMAQCYGGIQVATGVIKSTVHGMMVASSNLQRREQ